MPSKILWKIYAIFSAMFLTVGTFVLFFSDIWDCILMSPYFLITAVVWLYAFDLPWKLQLNKRIACGVLLTFSLVDTVWMLVETYVSEPFEMPLLIVYVPLVLFFSLDATAMYRYGIVKETSAHLTRAS
jgi:hypothetical protein